MYFQFFLFVFVLVFTLSVSNPSLADQRYKDGVRKSKISIVNPYDPMYKAGGTSQSSGASGQPSSDKSQGGGGHGPFFFSSTHHSIHFIRSPDAGPEEAVLRITQPISVNGCADVVTPMPVTEKDGPMLWVDVGLPEVKVDKSVRQAAHYGCTIESAVANADVTLNRKDLMQSGVKKIAFRNELGVEVYGLSIDGEKLSLVYKKNTMFKPSTQHQNRDPLTYWFYPDNTVILKVPHGADHHKIASLVEAFAKDNNLTPLDRQLPGFDSSLHNKNLFYFVDADGDIASTLDYQNDSVLGQITVDEEWYGPQGPYTKPRNLKVVAKRPGLWE